MVISAWLSLSMLMIMGAIDAYRRIGLAQIIINRPLIGQLVHLDNAKQDLWVPSWQRLNTGDYWAYVSNQQGIDVDFQPKLEALQVPVGDWVDDKRLEPLAHQRLQQLMQAASQAGYPLIVTSAYRSATAQRKLLGDVAQQRGHSYANDYVAQPGRSEHQLGLAVDFSRYSPACQAAFAACQLDNASADWLAQNAHQYGFILRYPVGKTPITGVQPESWHYRYVGRDMAALVQSSGLTFDEVYQQLIKQRPVDNP